LFLIFCFVSGIEVAYQEAVALKRQEELIREEEEEAGLLEHHMKGKRGGGANEKDKRAKKKQVLVPYILHALVLFSVSYIEPCYVKVYQWHI
jgi:hypothetical protein